MIEYHSYPEKKIPKYRQNGKKKEIYIITLPLQNIEVVLTLKEESDSKRPKTSSQY